MTKGFWLKILIVIITVLLPLILNGYQLQVMVMVGIFSILTLSLNVISGYGGMISLGHAGFFLVGAYTSAILTVDAGVNPWLALIAAILVTALFGLLLSFPALKLSGHFLAVITIAFGLIMQILAINMEWLTGGIEGVSQIPRPSIFGYDLKGDNAFYYLVAVVLIATFWLLKQILHSDFGRSLRAVRDDEVAASCMGIDIRATKIIAFVLSAGVAGLAGALYAHFVRYLNPDSFTLEISIRVFLMVIIGGIGSLGGSILGAATVYLLPEFLRFLDNYYYLAFGLAVVLVMRFLPGGLISLGPILERGISRGSTSKRRRKDA